MLQAYEELVDFIATGTTPAKVIAFRPSATTRIRVENLIRQEKIQAYLPKKKQN